MYKYATSSLSIPLSMPICCFHILAVIKSAAQNIEVQVSFKIMFFFFWIYKFRSGITGSYGSSHLSFLKNLHTVLSSGCTSLHACGKFIYNFLRNHPVVFKVTLGISSVHAYQTHTEVSSFSMSLLMLHIVCIFFITPILVGE